MSAMVCNLLDYSTQQTCRCELNLSVVEILFFIVWTVFRIAKQKVNRLYIMASKCQTFPHAVKSITKETERYSISIVRIACHTTTQTTTAAIVTLLGCCCQASCLCSFVEQRMQKQKKKKTSAVVFRFHIHSVEKPRGHCRTSSLTQSSIFLDNCFILYNFIPACVSSKAHWMTFHST